MPRARQADPTRKKPLTVPALIEYGAFEVFTRPAAHDPNGTWSLTWRIWLVGSRKQRFPQSRLTIARTPADGRMIRLDVTEAVQQAGGTLQRTKAQVECRSDRLCTPIRWELESVLLDADRESVPETTLSQTGEIEGGKLRLTTGERLATRPVPEPLTSNWSLFEAVPRLPGEGMPPLGFAMLEGLGLLKEGQRLSYHGAQTVEFADGELELTGYHQVGSGILPFQYWLDGRGCLVAAITGTRAYILTEAEEG